MPPLAEAIGEKVLAGLLTVTDALCYVILAVMALSVTAEVLSRYLLGISLQVAEEVASLGLVCLIFLSLPATFRDQGFLRIDAIYGRFSPCAKRALGIVFHLAAAGVSGIYVVQFARLTWDSFQRGTRSDMALATPNYVPQIAMLAGMALLVLVIAVGLVRLVRGRGRSGV